MSGFGRGRQLADRLRVEEQARVDAQVAVGRCAFCPVTFEASVGEVRAWAVEHRVGAHPEVKPRPRFQVLRDAKKAEQAAKLVGREIHGGDSRPTSSSASAATSSPRGSKVAGSVFCVPPHPGPASDLGAAA